MAAKKAWPTILLITAAVQLVNLVNIPFLSTRYTFDTGYFNNGVLATEVIFDHETNEGYALQAGGALTAVALILAIVALATRGARLAAGIAGIVAGVELLWATPYAFSFSWDTITELGGVGMWVSFAAAATMVIAGILTIVLRPVGTVAAHGNQQYSNLQAYPPPPPGASGGIPDQEARRSCPWCAELIQPAAVVCRFCGREVPAADQPGAVAQPANDDADQSPPAAVRSPSPPSDLPPSPPADPPPTKPADD